MHVSLVVCWSVFYVACVAFGRVTKLLVSSGRFRLSATQAMFYALTLNFVTQKSMMTSNFNLVYHIASCMQKQPHGIHREHVKCFYDKMFFFVYLTYQGITLK